MLVRTSARAKGKTRRKFDSTNQLILNKRKSILDKVKRIKCYV